MTSYEAGFKEFEHMIDSQQEKLKVDRKPPSITIEKEEEAPTFTRTVGFQTSSAPIGIPSQAIQNTATAEHASYSPERKLRASSLSMMGTSAPSGPTHIDGFKNNYKSRLSGWSDEKKLSSPESNSPIISPKSEPVISITPPALEKKQEQQKSQGQSQKQQKQKKKPNPKPNPNQQPKEKMSKEERKAAFQRAAQLKAQQRGASAPPEGSEVPKGKAQQPAKPKKQFDDSKKRTKADKSRILQLQPHQKQVDMCSHLPQYERGTSLKLNVGFSIGEIHPSILELGLKYAEGTITGSNARCVAMLQTFSKIIEGFQSPSGVFFKDFDIKPLVQFLVDCRPISISMGNAINYLKLAINATKKMNEQEAKSYIIEKIEKFIQERIVVADEVISDSAISKINDGDVILTYARSSVVERVIKAAHSEGKQFRVIVVDSRPRKEGKTLLRNLVDHGVRCTYAMINSISYIFKEVTKVFVGAYTMMANGNLISRSGTALIATMAHTYHVPFIVCCETYKFTERVQLESLSFNELGDPDELISTDLGEEKILQDWMNVPSLKVLNLLYDLTPSQFINMVITEVGMVPATSVPAILREYRLAV